MLVIFLVKRLKLILDRGNELEDWHKWGLLDYMVVGIQLSSALHIGLL